MKMNKRKVFVTALAVCLVAILSLGSLAWFTDTDSAKNEFFVTDSDKKPDDVFSVTVTEFVANDGDTTETSVADGYEFNDVAPGDLLTKRPFVTNTGKYNQYIRVTVTISDAAAFADALNTNTTEFDVASAFKGINTADLVFDSKKEENDSLIYVYYVDHVVVPNESIKLFDAVEIPTALTQYHFANDTLSDGTTPNTLKDGFTIDIFAEAVQSDNTVTVATQLNSVEAAKEAFDTVNQ